LVLCTPLPPSEAHPPRRKGMSIRGAAQRAWERDRGRAAVGRYIPER